MYKPSAAGRAGIHRIDDVIYLVTLPVALPGFDFFIGAWLYRGESTLLIDVGPAASSGALLSALAHLGIRRIDLILLTHIHIDHAGGAGIVSDVFPQARVVCHPQAAAHLIDPLQLWQGSLKTLGDVAQAYGPFDPIPAERLLTADRLDVSWITPIATPGHAPHHYSYLIGDVLFAGEAAGICLPLSNGGRYLRPATPPRFFKETYLSSLDNVIARRPRAACYGHLGFQTDAMDLFTAHRGQIERWHEWIDPKVASTADDVDLHRAMRACRDELLVRDPLLAGLADFSPEVQEREKGFLLNAVKGFWGYLSGRRT